MTSNSRIALPWKILPARVPALVFGLGILLLLPSVWSERSITGQDEYWLSLRTPMEMQERGEWLTPWLNGQPRLQKPPLIYWAILLNYKLFGINLVSARIWGVLSGAGLALCACWFSRELFRSDGLLAGLLALATIGVAVEGRQAMLDLPAALFSTLAVLWFLKWLKVCCPGFSLSGGVPEHDPTTASPQGKFMNAADGARTAVSASSPVHTQESTRTRLSALPGKPTLALPTAVPGWRGLSFILLSALCLGLSFLTKGPVGFLFFGAGVLACLVVFRIGSCMRRSWWQVLLAFVLLTAICLPWPLAMRHLWREQLSKTMGQELMARQFGHWTPGSPLSALSGALGLILPWTPLMLAAIWAQFRSADALFLKEKRFLIGWFLLAAMPFFFMRSFERYMLALIPAQIAFGAAWLEESKPRTRELLLRTCIFLLAVISVAICVFAWWFKLATWGPIVSLLVTGWAVSLVFRRTHPHWVAFAAALLFTLALGCIYPRFGINALPENLSAQLASYPVTLFDPAQPSLLSMRLGRSLQAFDPKRWQSDVGSAQGAEIVFVEAIRRQPFLELLQTHQLQSEEKGSFRTFFSRQAWLRFARRDATKDDWRAALRERSLEGLKAEFHWYRVSAANATTKTEGAK